MAEQNRPASAQQAPDPASSYERANPQKEAGTGRLDNKDATPTASPDRQNDAVANRQDPTRQINGEDIPNQRGSATPAQPDHSMNEEEPDGWDQAPTDIKDPRHKRHPRTDGKDGTP